MKHLGVLRVPRAVRYCWSLGWEEWGSRKEIRQKRWSRWNVMILGARLGKLVPECRSVSVSFTSDIRSTRYSKIQDTA